MRSLRISYNYISYCNITDLYVFSDTNVSSRVMQRGRLSWVKDEISREK